MSVPDSYGCLILCLLAGAESSGSDTGTVWMPVCVWV